MKCILALILTAAMTAALVSCGSKLTPSQYADDTTAANITMQTQFPVYAADFERIQVTLTNNTGATLEFGAEWSLEIKQGDKWMTLPFVENAGWISLLYMVEDGGTHTFDVSRNMLDFEFVDGTYRVVKEFNRGAIGAAAQFEIGESNVTAESPYGYLPLESLPADYTFAASVADGCVGVGAISDIDVEILDRFFSDYKNGVSSQLRLCEKTADGLVITDILYEKVLGDRIRYAIDTTRADGVITAANYGALVTDGASLYLSNRYYYSEDAADLLAILNGVEWSGRDDAVAVIAEKSAYIEEWYGTNASYWSPDGMRNITLNRDEPLEFGVSRIFEEGGNAGSMNGLPVDICMVAITDAVWQPDNRTVMFICETDDPEMTGYVFYDTDEYKVISYTASQYGYTVEDDGEISIPE